MPAHHKRHVLCCAVSQGVSRAVLGLKLDLTLLAVVSSGNDYLPSLRGAILEDGECWARGGGEDGGGGWAGGTEKE